MPVMLVHFRVTGYFAYWSFRLQHILPTGHFVYRPFHLLDSSPTYFYEVVTYIFKNAMKLQQNSFVTILNFRICSLEDRPQTVNKVTQKVRQIGELSSRRNDQGLA